MVDKVLLLHTDKMIERQTIRRTDRQNSISTALSKSGVTKIFNMKLIPTLLHKNDNISNGSVFQ